MNTGSYIVINQNRNIWKNYMDMEIYYTFQNTHAAILAERVLLSAGLPVKVRPLPGAIKAGCGICLSIPLELRKQAEDALKKHGANYADIYQKCENKFIKQ